MGGRYRPCIIRMFSQIANIMLYCLFIFFWILVGLVLWVKISWQTFCERLYLLVVYTLEGWCGIPWVGPVYERDPVFAEHPDERCSGTA
ncbi:TraD N-terminal domain-containing protein [Escherichia coli]